MKNIIFIFLGISVQALAQVGVNTVTPSAMLDVVSKGNTSSTKAFNVKNSDNIELLKVLDNKNLGINLGTASPTTILHVKEDVKHQNLPLLTSPYDILTVANSGAGITKATTTKYFYFKRSTSFGSFTLSNTNTYSNIPFADGTDVKGNTVGFDFGTDASATVNSQSVSNIKYIVIPEPGVYLFEMYQTALCTGFPTTSSNTGQIGINTVFATANNGSSTYSTNTIFRDYAIARRSASGTTNSVSYDYANPQKLVVAYQSTTANEKVALFVNYAGGDTFTTQVCNMNRPASSDNYGYLIVTKL